MILVPLPSAAGNHQYYNARYFSDNNAAILIEEKLLANNVVEKKIKEIFSNDNDFGVNANSTSCTENIHGMYLKK